jgi:hypothetical protein
VTGAGDCYERAIHEALDIPAADRDHWRVVHGWPTGQGPIAGIKHGHAWLERTDPVPDDLPPNFRNVGAEFWITCVDRSNGKDVEWPRALFYGIGNIDPAECRYYEIVEAFEVMSEYHHYGPWDADHPPVAAMWDDDEDEVAS